jgi:hypothetical protein
MPRLTTLIAVALITTGFLQIPLSAQDRKGKGPAFTQPPADEPNYALMGEFIGLIEADGSEPELLGLQIRPVGGDNFDAMSFMGGLPGQDKFNPEPIRMIGRRSGDFVVLSGGPWAIFVEHDSCLLLNREGNKVGRLERVQRTSPTLGARPPEGALVLFDGTSIEHFSNAQMTKDGLLMEGADVKPMFQDFNLHIEFRLPYMPEAEGQARANSGLYLQSRYECQVLDSFGLDPLINGCGALYKFRAPDVNMCLPPLVWQTYDVQLTAPRWAADGSKIRDAHVTSWINGVKVQDNVALPNKTGAGKEEEPVLLPTKIQNHGDPVRFRNIWVVDRGLATGEFPVYPTKEELEAAAKAKQDKKDQKAAAEKKRKEKVKQQAAAKKKKAAAEKEKAEAAKAEMKETEKEVKKDKPEPTKEPAKAAAEKTSAPESADEKAAEESGVKAEDSPTSDK